MAVNEDRNTVTDFIHGQDRIEYRAMNGMADLSIRNVGDDVHIVGGGTRIVVLNDDEIRFTSEDFLF